MPTPSLGAGIDPGELAGWLYDTFHAPDYRPPVLPRVAMQLLELSRNPEVPIRAIAELLEQDPMLTAVMMRSANSALHRGSGEILTIEGAVARLGLRRIGELFLETAVNVRIFHAPSYEPAMDSLRAHSTATAHVAKLFGRFVGLAGGQTFLCGLLHDVGVAAGFIAIDEHFGEHEKPSLDAVWGAVRQHHEAAGRLLQQSWGLPETVGEVLAQHHFSGSAQQASAMTAAVALADGLTTQLGIPLLDEVDPTMMEAARERLGIDELTLHRVRLQAEFVVGEVRGRQSGVVPRR